MNNYVAYHLHDDLSLLDSCTKYIDYIDKAIELNQKAICFTNHGNIYNWYERKHYCEKNGIKYLHGCEVYLTEKLFPKERDNYHTILISKNFEGFKELNKLIDLSTQEDHMYYKPRITFDEFLNISNNVIKISACLASPLNKLDKDNSYYEKLARHYDYYEIQPHKDMQQVIFNEYLYELSKKYNKSLIVGTDTHSLNNYKAECRSILQKAKGIEYSNEDSFDLTYKSYDELVECFKNQNTSIPLGVILDAINNTNVAADSTDEIKIDNSYKYPKLSDNDEELLKIRIVEKYQEKINNKIIDNSNEYLENIKEEYRVLKKIGMCSFILFMSELCTWCRENDIPVGFCRGSVGGSTVAYILDIIDVNPVKWKTVFSRFANEDRIEIGDIDLDFSPSQRQLVYDYIINRFGIDKSAYILAIGTVSDKGTIDEIGRALKYPLGMVAEIKKEYDSDQELAKEKHKELFYYFDGLINTSISQSIHPAGIVASPVTLPDNYGCFWSKGKRIMQINMEEIHEVNLVKYDILGLKNIEIIKDTYKLLNKKYPLSNDVDWDDEKVWNDIITSPVGIFQFEGNFAFELLKKYKPKKINDLSLANASLRPSGTSYRDRLIAREFNKNPSEQIDELLKDNNGFLVFQEDTIKFLQDICGLSGSDADNVRRAIGRKQLDRLEKALPSILEGYCNKSPKPRNVAEEEAKEFLQIISDSSNYQFGYNHSTGYSMIGYLCGYLRYHHPLEFITAYLNNSNNEDDIVCGTQLAESKGIKINPPKFRYSRSKYMFNSKTNSIYKGISSIKFLSEECAEFLYSLRENTYNTFIELLIDLKDAPINSRQLDILIKVGFFDEFGKRQKLLDCVVLFESIYGKKQIKKDNAGNLIDIISKYSKQTEKMFKDIDFVKILDEAYRRIEDKEMTISEIISSEVEFFGYACYINLEFSADIVVVSKCETNKYGTPFVSLYSVNNGNTIQMLKVDKKYFNEKPLNDMDLIKVVNIEKKHKRKKVDGKWTVSDETELILTQYRMVVQ